MTSASTSTIILCPGQGAQAVGMGKAWYDASAAARAVFAEADAILAPRLGAPLSQLCLQGPAERLNQTDVSQPAIYTCSVACHHALLERENSAAHKLLATMGLSLGEYTALHLAGVFSFADGLKLVAERGRLMQEAAVASKGGMVALIGADEPQAQEVCDRVTASSPPGTVLVCANFNAPGQIVLSGHAEACQKGMEVASGMGLKATVLTVAGAFHSPLMQPAADRMAEVLATTAFGNPKTDVWSNVTAQPHDRTNLELLKRRLVEQIVKPVRWSQSCAALASSGEIGDDVEWRELAPGSVLRGLMRRINRDVKVVNYDQP